MCLRFAAFIVFACCLLVVTKAESVSFEAKDFDAIATEADLIFIGTGTGTSPRRTGSREIVTDYRFGDLEIVKGTASAGALTVTMLGGRIGAESLTVAGAPTFHQGVRYLVFVNGNGSVMFPLVGGDQGIFQIRKDAVSGVALVHDYAGRALTRLPGRASTNSLDRLQMRAGETVSQAAFVAAIRAKVGDRLVR